MDNFRGFPQADFDDIISANSHFAAGFQHSELTGTARKGLAIVTCMDSRISPLDVVGMQAGDAKILRNAGARVTEDVLRTLVLASYLLGVTRVLVMPHTDCRMAISDEASIHTTIKDQFGVDTSSLEFRTDGNAWRVEVNPEFAAIAIFRNARFIEARFLFSPQS